MIIPSIDLEGGRTVQLVGGEELAIDAGDPAPLAERFGVVGDIAVIDLDAAKGTGNNTALIEDVITRTQCRVGGGIRSVERAVQWLDRGARQVILGTAATPQLLRQLPRDRVMAAVDARNGEVVVEGWRTQTGANLLDRVRSLAPYVGGFLVTFVEREGRFGGTALDQVPALLEAAGSASLTIAGGVTSAEEVAWLDARGVDCQVGMALYNGALGLGDAFAACASSDRPDSLIPTVVTDVHDRALGLVYSSRATLAELVDTRQGIYHSRKRGRWHKGATSGAVQEVLSVRLDCDRDAARVVVRQSGSGFCHLGSRTCWGPERGLPALARRLAERVATAPAGSYTRRLLDDPDLLASKLTEEARELAEATTPTDIAHETADVLYFALVAMVRGEVPLDAVEAVLDRRSSRLIRRRGDAKES